ncbi:MAG: hypothetical protein GY786_12410 [Proteobacteria bacterium]|nr:hypothetical protein [Pseudomonadota bacterium]
MFFNEILKSVRSLLGKQEEINKKINQLANELCPILNHSQKNDLLALMDQVMRADRNCTKAEKELYGHIKVILTGVPIY